MANLAAPSVRGVHADGLVYTPSASFVGPDSLTVQEAPVEGPAQRFRFELNVTSNATQSGGAHASSYLLP